MLKTLFKVIFFVAIVVLLMFLVLRIADVEGKVLVALGGQSIELSPLQVAFALLGLVFLTWLAFKLIALLIAMFKFLNGDETAISRYFSFNRKKRGYDTLSKSMLALAAGDGELAFAKATRARKYLDNPEVADLVAAQAAEISGNHKKAEETYKRLVQNDDTRFVGVRGLMYRKLEEGDTETAKKLAERAFEMRPQNVQVQDTLMRLQADSGDWAGARSTLAAKLKAGNLPRNVHRRRDAVLAISEAKCIAQDDTPNDGKTAAIEANRLAPDLVPAAIQAATIYIENGEKKNATTVLTKAWKSQPHPDIAACFAEIEPDETPEARIKRFRKLTKVNADHPETQMLLAELHIAAEDFPAARADLKPLLESHPTARVMALMAAVEKGSGADDQTVNAWLARAVTAPRGPQWTCTNCHVPQADWHPVCPNCQAFDTLEWKSPPNDMVSTVNGAEMLPLMIGNQNVEDLSGKETLTTPKANETAPDAEIIDAEEVEVVVESAGDPAEQKAGTTA